MVKSEKGQSLTEFALLLPLLLLLLCGITDLGRVLYSYMQLNMATQEAVRLGGLGKGDAEISAFARSYLHITNPVLLVVVISPTEAVRKSGDYVKVTLKAPFTYITPLLPTILPSPYIVETDSTIRVE